MVIAIDGPSGAGKSTVARAVATALGFTYLDSGAMYRAVALATLRDPGPGAPAHARARRIELDGRVLLDGEDVSAAVRAPEVSAEASRIAADPQVRAALVARQRELLRVGSWVAEGRDIGTVVAPEAELKVFLTASEGERAARRARELGVEVEAIAAEQRARDERDRTRAHSPAVAAPNAVLLDSGGLAIDEVVQRIVVLAREHR